MQQPLKATTSPFYHCLFIAPDDAERVQDFLQRAAVDGLTDELRYRLWSLESGVLCLAIPLEQRGPRWAPASRSAGCFCPVAPGGIRQERLEHARLAAERLRRLALLREIDLPQGIFCYVAEEPWERVLSLAPKEGHPVGEAPVRVILVLHESPHAWSGTLLNEAPRIAFACEKDAWNDISPSLPSLFAVSPSGARS